MSVDTAAQSVSLDWLLDSMQERKWARSSSTWSLRDSHISTRAVSLFSSIVSFPNGSLGRSFAQVGAAKPTTIAQTVTNIATCIFSTPRSAHRSPLQTGRQIVQRAEPCVFSIHLGETHDGDLRTSAKSAGKSLGTSLHQSPIDQIAEIVGRRIMFPCIRSARLNEYTL